MEVIESVVNCASCNKVLESPMLLPCGELVCKKHIDNEKTTIYCRRCDKDHDVEAHTANPANAIERLLIADFDKMTLGHGYSAAKSYYDNLADMIADYELVRADPAHRIYTEVAELKAYVDSKREQLKKVIDAKANELIDELERYEARCKTHTQTSEYAAKLVRLDFYFERAKSVQDKVKRELNKFKVDEDFWRQINMKMFEVFSKVFVKLHRFVYDDLLMAELDLFSKRAHGFESEVTAQISCKKTIPPILSPSSLRTTTFSFSKIMMIQKSENK